MWSADLSGKPCVSAHFFVTRVMDAPVSTITVPRVGGSLDPYGATVTLMKGWKNASGRVPSTRFAASIFLCAWYTCLMDATCGAHA